MKLPQLLLTLILSSFFFACRTAPEMSGTSESVPEKQLFLGGVLAEKMSIFKGADSPALSQPYAITDQLSSLKRLFEDAKAASETLPDDFYVEWRAAKDEVSMNFEQLSKADLKQWLNLNDTLLKYSGAVCFADELESLFFNVNSTDVVNEAAVKSALITRRYDRLYINVYSNSAFDFEHTTGGPIRLAQETDYPFDGDIKLVVELSDKRYMDLFVRIPEWADFASVTVRGVKYPARAGEYAEIARQWENGDEVMISLGLKPSVLKGKDDAFAFCFGSLRMSYEAQPDLPASQPVDDPMQFLQLVSPAAKLTTFTFSGIGGHPLVLQPYFAETSEGHYRTCWIK